MVKTASRTADRESGVIDAAGYRLAAGRWRARTDMGKRPILFLNGFGGSVASAIGFITAFDDRDVIAFDVPGLGRSPDTPVPYSPMAMADAVVAILDHYDCAVADVVGLSWGGLLAQQIALQHAGRVGRLVLAATSTGMVMVPPDLSQWAHGIDKDGVDYGIVQRCIATASDWSNGVMDQMKRQRPRIGPGMLYQSLAFTGWSSAPWLTMMLRAPTLILANRHDPVVPMPNAIWLQQLIAGARLETVDSGGHFFLLSETDAARALIVDFLDG
ncbi:MAG: hypothetical protein RLZZ58_799 [Pseudomonadota bacterium]|jgi:pimeloyl-ACP methyl ester carboxylesterase